MKKVPSQKNHPNGVPIGHMGELMGSIQSNHLDLVLLDTDALQHSLTKDFEALRRTLGMESPLDWFEEKELIELRYQQILRDPEYQPWSLRAIVLREKEKMIGHIGFHTKPGAAYLQPFAPNGVEFGFTIFSEYRRNGYAREASLALMDWAYRQHAVPEFVLSISPNNVPSQSLARSLGFIKIGSVMDETDGVEDIYRLDHHPGKPAR